MDHHIDRRVILNQDSEFRALYEWSLRELDANGNKLGRDQLPWSWSLYFTASELALSDTISIEPDYDSQDAKRIVRERQIIQAKLHPDQGPYHETSYSMFGTDRTISTFQLHIEKLEDEDEQERCTVWGTASYTAEIDFRDETTEDCVIFYLYVHPERFAQYAEKIAASAVDEVVLRVGRVRGFYSDWSPSISTSEIKVLTNNEEHKVEIPSDCQIDPPRLGEVGETELYFRRLSKLDKARPETSEEAGDSTNDKELPEVSNDRAGHIQQLEVAVARTVDLLSSVRIAAWIIAILLLFILITKL